MKRNDGFILLELLLALTISAVALTLFWIATNNRMQMLSKLKKTILMQG
jgi:type II secretory pathway component PulJ